MAPDPVTFARRFESSYRTVVRFAYYRVGERELAKDIAAEAFRIAWEKEVDLSLAWLLSTAHNLIGNVYQHRQSHQKKLRRIQNQLPNEAEVWEVAIRDRELRDAMSRLKPASVQILRLTYWEGLSGIELAEYLGCSVAAALVRLSRARAELRRQLEPRLRKDSERVAGGEVGG